ncbi:MAG: peptidylprolyl isomerase, partial [Adlercreutzia equolifaciens]
DTGSAANGGDVGWDAPSTFVTEYQDALAGLEKDQIVAAPVKSEYGYHIIKVTDVYEVPEGGITSVDQLPTEFQEYLTYMEQSNASQNFSTWFEEYRNNAEITVNPMPEGLPTTSTLLPTRRLPPRTPRATLPPSRALSSLPTRPCPPRIRPLPTPPLPTPPLPTRQSTRPLPTRRPPTRLALTLPPTSRCRSGRRGRRGYPAVSCSTTRQPTTRAQARPFFVAANDAQEGIPEDALGRAASSELCRRRVRLLPAAFESSQRRQRPFVEEPPRKLLSSAKCVMLLP